MANLGDALKNEIARLARKELKVQVDPLRKANARLRGEVAGLKRVVRELERNAIAGARKQAKAASIVDAVDTASLRLRVTPAGVRAMRTKLGLSAEKFGKLVGVTGQTIYNWEADDGARPNGKRLEALIELRKLGKRAVKSRLESIA